MAEESKADTRTYSIFDDDAFHGATKAIQVSQLMRLKQASTNEDVSQVIQDLNVSDCLFCSFCNVSFPDQATQRQHYKLDWHRYNLKQHLVNKKFVSEEKFAQIAENDDMSSISGSESDTDSEQSSVTETEELSDERVSRLLVRRARVLFENEDGQLVSVYQCLLHNKKTEPPPEDQLVSLATNLPNQKNWMIFMLGGGHMAAAIFKGSEAIRHKTFHCYTVRAKQGGSQSSKDSSGRHSKSAGASLRRYNEQALTQHVQEILSSWAEDVAACHLIFVRAVGPFNRSVLFGGKNPALNKADPRLRTVPFPTRRATFSEVQRVHQLLSTITVYNTANIFRSNLVSPRRPRREEEVEGDRSKSPTPASPKKQIDRAKSRVSPVRELPKIITALAALETSDSESDGELHHMQHNDEEVSFNNSLKEFEDTVPKGMKKKKRKKKEKPPEPELSAEVRSFRRRVVAACEAADMTLLLLSLTEEGSVVSDSDKAEGLSQTNSDGLTLLQSSAQRGLKDIVWILLENGADPCVKDKRAMTAYDFAPDKETRNVFRRFMGEFPDRYDYSKSHIPSALTSVVEQEQVEKRREVRKAKRQKERERRLADEPRRRDEEEKKRFLELNDRDKRALAAERRMLAAAGKSGLVLTRCYLCAANITGKVPFTYENFLFCSMECLKGHRKKQKITL